jgi:glycosyltransferase involved in cell wall biosynthesis
VNRPAAAKPRLLYLLPRYDADSPEHFYHLYGFLRALRERLPMEILVEKLGQAPPEDLPLRALRIRAPVFRLAEEFVRFLAARLRGVKIFYVHYSYTGAVAASLVVRLLGGRAFYWNCGMYADMAPFPEEPWIRRVIFRWNSFCINTSARLCTHFATGTPRMAGYYARHARIPLAKIVVLPNFVELVRFRAVSRSEARRRLKIDPKRKVVLFLHRVSRRRGAELLPGLARAVEKAIGPFILMVVGDGPYLPALRALSAELGSQSPFDFRNWVPNREVPLYFRAADLYVMPSSVEGFPRVLVEAMAASCPFVAFDVGGVRDVVSPEQAECAVAADDPRALQRQCVRALKDGRLRKKWGAAGERRVAFFSQERVLDAFVRMIDGRPLDWNAFFDAGGTHDD